METALLLVLVLLAGAGLVAALRRRSAGGDAAVAERVSALVHEVGAMNERFQAQTAFLAQRLEGIDSRMTDTQVASQDLARDIFGRLGEVQRATESVAEQARQFTTLQDLLKAPKARGGLGEAMLEELLRQVLPRSAFEMQHRFSSGDVVDAVVHAAGRKICIDSKFPLANYQRMCDASDDVERAAAERAFGADVTSHISAIASRYIVPDEDTLDFAVMYVPAEGVYAEVLRLSHAKRPLFEIAMEARVVPMSPLNMYGYLQTILLGLKCMRIEENAERILGACTQLEQDMQRFTEEYDILGRHLTNAHARYGDASRKLDRFRLNLERVASLGDDVSEERPPLEVVSAEGAR